MDKKEAKVAQNKALSAFTKEQLLESRKSGMNKDVLASVLKDGKTYTMEEAEELVNCFNKRKVK